MDLDLELVARALFAICEQAATLALADPGAFTPARYARFAGQLIALPDPR